MGTFALDPWNEPGPSFQTDPKGANQRAVSADLNAFRVPLQQILPSLTTVSSAFLLHRLRAKAASADAASL